MQKFQYTDDLSGEDTDPMRQTNDKSEEEVVMGDTKLSKEEILRAWFKNVCWRSIDGALGRYSPEFLSEQLDNKDGAPCKVQNCVF